MTGMAPELIGPADGASFFFDDLINFEWRPADLTAVRAKLDLYVSRRAERPWEDCVARRSWDLRPHSEWRSYRDFPLELGLERHATYYWMVAQEEPGHGMSLLSRVRSFHVRGQKLDDKISMSIKGPGRVRRGVPVKCSVEIGNHAANRIRLFFPTSKRLAFSVFQKRGILADKLVWSDVKAVCPSARFTDLQGGASFVETFEWSQNDQDGDPVLGDFEYRIAARCLAEDFHAEASCDVRIVL